MRSSWKTSVVLTTADESRWDCQFRHRNLTIESGHTYRITYSVNPSNSGHMYPKLGNMSKDDQELWHSNGDELSCLTKKV